jgi:hypothetical protein
VGGDLPFSQKKVYENGVFIERLRGWFQAGLSGVVLSGVFISTAMGDVPREWTGKDVRTGKEHRLIFTQGNTLLVFLSARCPCSLSHLNSLRTLAETYPKVRFIGVHANREEPADEVKKELSWNKVPFPVLEDTDQALANALGALKTPHAFLIGSRGGVVYRGGVDDSHDAARAKNRYLASALDAILGGRTPEPNETRALGCSIAR